MVQTSDDVMANDGIGNSNSASGLFDGLFDGAFESGRQGFAKPQANRRARVGRMAVPNSMAVDYVAGARAAGGAAGRVGYGETWAKVILMGEHSVVYGYPAVALPVRQLRMRAWAKPVPRGSGLGQAVSDSPVEIALGGRLHALDYSGPLALAGSRFGGVERAVRVARDFAGRPDLDFDITTDCSFPAGRGMGSSAASAGAVIRAILDACSVKASRRQLLELTQKAEAITHGRPSGLDTVTTSSPLAVTFKSGSFSEFSVDMDAYLVIADSGIVGSTREAVGLVSRQSECDGARVERIMDELGMLARSSQGDLTNGNVDRLGRRMNRAHALLAQLKVSHPVVDRLVGVACGAGAVGAKMTGGGLGGCLVALAGNKAVASDVRGALLHEGAANAWVHALNTNEMQQCNVGAPVPDAARGCSALR